MNFTVKTHENVTVHVTGAERVPCVGETLELRKGGVHIRHKVLEVSSIVELATGKFETIEVQVGGFD